MPFAVPHVPFSFLLAVQVEEVFPPFTPAQVQVRGQLPLTDDAVPTEHFSPTVDGADVLFVLCAVPHAPLVGQACVLQSLLIAIPLQPAIQV
ncbi:MAG: hypothetical protein LBP53_05155 [Candidatus Peribacteria bacterium]|jgi:hypothetical protein|nr:hypothetical protein [Candidatus Peribacteria bacterium]